MGKMHVVGFQKNPIKSYILVQTKAPSHQHLCGQRQGILPEANRTTTPGSGSLKLTLEQSPPLLLSLLSHLGARRPVLSFVLNLPCITSGPSAGVVTHLVSALSVCHSSVVESPSPPPLIHCGRVCWYGSNGLAVGRGEACSDTLWVHDGVRLRALEIADKGAG